MDDETRNTLNRALGELLNHQCDHGCGDDCGCSVGEAKSLLRLALAPRVEPTAAEERAAVVAAVNRRSAQAAFEDRSKPDPIKKWRAWKDAEAAEDAAAERAQRAARCALSKATNQSMTGEELMLETLARHGEVCWPGTVYIDDLIQRIHDAAIDEAVRQCEEIREGRETPTIGALVARLLAIRRATR